MKNQAATQELSSDVDLTPMLDVVFILLIFFIVTTSFIKEKGLEANLLPERNTGFSKTPSTLFTVDANNNVIFDNRVINEKAIRSVLAQKLAENPQGMSLIVNAHEASSVETYVAILDAAKQANVTATALKSYK